jgi:hypothetical protein
MGAAAANPYGGRASAPGSIERWQASSGTRAGAVDLVAWYAFDGMSSARLLHVLQRADPTDPQTFATDRCDRRR